jgi:hypothetical protein
MTINIRFVTESDKEKLKQFYTNVYGETHILNNPLHHDWQFNNPYNKNFKSIVIAEDNGKIVSHMGLVPYPIKVFDKVFNGVFHVSGYTLDEYRGMGCFSKLIELSSSSFDSMLGLSITKASNSVHLKFGGKFFGDIHRFIKILQKNRMQKFLNENNDLQLQVDFKHTPEDFIRIKELDDSYESFWNKVKQRFPITVERTRQYLEWRYFNHPLIKYHFMILKHNDQIVGYTILRFEDKNDELKAVRIVDLVVLEQFEISILQNIINYCNSKVDFVDFYSIGNFYMESLFTLGFFDNLTEKLPIPTVFNPIDTNRSSINFYFDFKNYPSTMFTYYDQNNLFFVKADSDQDRAY